MLVRLSAVAILEIGTVPDAVVEIGSELWSEIVTGNGRCLNAVLGYSRGLPNYGPECYQQILGVLSGETPGSYRTRFAPGRG